MSGQEHMEASDVRKIMAGDYVPSRPGKRPCPDVLTIELPIPNKATHPNSRGHWSKIAKAKKEQRHDAHAEANVALRHGGYGAPHWERASIKATFHKPGNQAKLSDQDGMIAWLKATADGLQDASIIANDSGLVWLPPVELLGEEAGKERKLVLVITKLESEQS